MILYLDKSDSEVFATDGIKFLVALELSLPERDLGPLEVPLERAGPGHFSAYDVEVPLPGDWTIEVRALVDDFTEATARDTVRIRGR